MRVMLVFVCRKVYPTEIAVRGLIRVSHQQDFAIPRVCTALQTGHSSLLRMVPSKKGVGRERRFASREALGYCGTVGWRVTCALCQIRSSYLVVILRSSCTCDRGQLSPLRQVPVRW